MKYQVNEAQFQLPDDLVDRSVNMLMSPDGTGVSYVITRDQLNEGEVLESFVARQLKDLSRQVSKFREISREPALFGSKGQQKAGLQIESTFKQQGSEIFQRQALLQPVGDSKVLIVTATAFRVFTKNEQTQWLQTLESCVLNSFKH